MSRFWRLAFRMQYRLLAIMDPAIRAFWRRFGIGNTIDFEVARRSGGGTRSRLLGLLRVENRWYLGHPNGDVGWTRDLEAAGVGTIRWPDGRSVDVSGERLEHGAERESAIRATMQHPFPGNVIYRLAWGHIREAGAFFRLDRGDAAPAPQ